VRGAPYRVRWAVAGVGTTLALALAVSAMAQGRDEFSAFPQLRSSLDEEGAPEPRRPVQGGRAQQRRQASPYGTPPGSGAGRTGYISTNPPPTARPGAGRATRTPQARPTAGATPPAPAAASAARPGSPATGPTRPGASIDVPPGTTTRPVRRRPPEEDPFEPVGIRVGSFILRPAIETTGGYDSNPERTRGGRGSSLITIAPELQVRSQWSRHALNAALRGSYTAYGQANTLNRPYFDGRVNGRIDITRNTQVDLETRGTISTDNPGSPDLPAGLARLPIYTTLGASAGLTHRFNRFEVTGKGSVDRTVYENSQLTDGTVVSNRDRNFNQYAAQLRVAYELTPGMKPFAEVQHDHRVRDVPIDSFGIRRDSRGTTARVGTTFEISRKLTGEVSIGYLTRTYQDPSLPELRGLIADGSLIWTMTGLTTVRLTAKSSGDESTLPGVAGVLRRDVGVQVDHAFRRWLIGTARLGYGLDDYEGSPRKDERYVAAVGMTYKLTRTVQIKGELRQEWLRSSEPGNDYTATIALVGLRLQR
jgi:hypothetical protein